MYIRLILKVINQNILAKMKQRLLLLYYSLTTVEETKTNILISQKQFYFSGFEEISYYLNEQGELYSFMLNEYYVQITDSINNKYKVFTPFKNRKLFELFLQVTLSFRGYNGTPLEFLFMRNNT